MAAMELKLEEATLSNLCDGELENQFQEVMRADVEKRIMAQLDVYEQSGGRVTVKLNAEVIIDIDVKSLSMYVSGRVDMKSPKRALISRSIYHNAKEGFRVAEREPSQEPLKFKRPETVK